MFAGRARHAAPLEMSIAVFGASGLLGSEVTYQALQRGEDVVAFLRDPAKVRFKFHEYACSKQQQQQLRALCGSSVKQSFLQSSCQQEVRLTVQRRGLVCFYVVANSLRLPFNLYAHGCL